MADSIRYSLRLNKAKIAARLGITLGEVEHWLISKGFEPAGERWLADGHVDLLRPDEITERRTRETIDGVTFFDTLPGGQAGK